MIIKMKAHNRSIRALKRTTNKEVLYHGCGHSTKCIDEYLTCMTATYYLFYFIFLFSQQHSVQGYNKTKYLSGIVHSKDWDQQSNRATQFRRKCRMIMPKFSTFYVPKLGVQAVAQHRCLINMSNNVFMAKYTIYITLFTLLKWFLKLLSDLVRTKIHIVV